jgi:polyisoprenoid-binding protein YceI
MASKTIWAIDPGHSDIRFKVKHLAIANVSGAFNVFEGQLETEGDAFEQATIHFEADAGSLSTNHPERDNHLRSDLFLHVEKFPKITFNGVLRKGVLEGDLTILETTKPVSFAVEHTGIGKGRFGDIRAGFEVNGRINRKDFGLHFHLLNEAGDLIVGDEVKIQCEVELLKK